MQLGFKTITLKKRFPLAISRGTSSGSTNLFVSVTQDGITGWGEMHPGIKEGADTAEKGQQTLSDFFTAEISQLSVQQINTLGRQRNIPPCALAALDIALWDWLAKKANLPLYQLLGLPKPTVDTSITLGINPPEIVRQRIPLLLEDTGIKSLKVKLGSSDGLATDKAMFNQVLESCAPYDVKIRVDANGGWQVDEAIEMMHWLSKRGVDYIEQPLKEGEEKSLVDIFHDRPLPIFVDESCRHADDIPSWENCVDGVNIKLMKCGGITEALNIIAVARAHKLKTMIGCMGESSLSISAAATISGIIDYIDLDSQLNLMPDPCIGATLQNGILMPNDAIGHGAIFRE